MLNVLPTMSINLPGKLMVSSASNKKLKDLPEMLVYLQRIVMVWPEILSVLYLEGYWWFDLRYCFTCNTNGFTCDNGGFIIVRGDDNK